MEYFDEPTLSALKARKEQGFLEVDVRNQRRGSRIASKSVVVLAQILAR
jgi:hypothetical protein